MKGKNVFVFFLTILFILFISLYIGQATGYYKYDNKKNILTKAAIKRYEKDIKAGKQLDLKNYLEEEKNYSNSFSKIGLKTSNFIEVSFNKILIFVFKQVEEEINYKK
ncbi:MAG: hypothetical protein IJF92_04955 [Bacilli bacterium]|nr:hypothetical protein [Bacilli bacterium]